MLTSYTLLAAASVAVVSAATQLRWTTDFGSTLTVGDSGTFGPDGPWQAVYTGIGTGNYDAIPLWPTAYHSMLVPSRLYNPRNSSTAEATNSSMLDKSWHSSPFVNETVDMEPSYFDLVALSFKPSGYALIDSMVVPADNWTISMVDNSTWFTPDVGILGLTSSTSSESKPGILETLKKNGNNSSQSYSLHMGSVPFEQSGSVVLGGYHQNRALGDLAVFDIDLGNPQIFLKNLTLGVETGQSPFEDSTALGSIWKGNGGSKIAEDLTQMYGGTKDSAVMVPSPESPFIYLPYGNCEAAAEHLPVTFNDRLGLYLWDTSSPLYTSIVQSPAYMGFTFSDRTAKEVTIKIPFALLNLTLEAPLVDEPTQYFPCKPTDSRGEGYWVLGRAFLQGAFLAYNFDKNVLFLAQAPGPDMAQSVMRDIKSDDVEFDTNPAEQFEESWRSTWVVLDDSSSGQQDATQDSVDNKGVSGGTIAGIVIGTLAGVMAIGLLAFLRWRRLKKDVRSTEVADELQKTPSAQEVPNSALSAEMEVPSLVHEAPGIEMKHELPVEPAEMDGREIKM